MAAYLIMRIEGGFINYNQIFTIALYQQFKEPVTAAIVADGYTINPDGTVTKN